jgi:hypothetical protein
MIRNSAAARRCGCAVSTPSRQRAVRPAGPLAAKWCRAAHPAAAAVQVGGEKISMLVLSSPASPPARWAAAPAPSGSRDRRQRRTTEPPGRHCAWSATLLLVRQPRYMVVTQFHVDAPVNNHATVFAEYARSGFWTAVRLGQFAAMAILLARLLGLFFPWTVRPDGRAGRVHHLPRQPVRWRRPSPHAAGKA